MTDVTPEKNSVRNIIRLTLMSGRNAGYVYESSGDGLSIGRGERNDLILEEPHVSMKHAEIRLSSGGYVYRDLESTNGSMVQREEKRTILDERTGYEKELRSGDRIILGDARDPVLIRFEQMTAPLPTTQHQTVAASCSLDKIRDVRELLLQDQNTLTRMYHFLEELQPLFDTEKLFKSTVSLLRSYFPQATRVEIFTRGPGEERFCRLSPESGNRNTDTPPLSRTILDQLLSTERSLLVEDTSVLFPDAHSLSGAGIRSLLCAPLWNQGRVSGIIQLSTDHKKRPFSRTDLEILTVFAHQVALVFEKIRLHEILQETEKKTHEENLYLRRQLDSRYRFENIVGASPAMQQVFTLMHKATEHDLPVLILGETGTGKELVARAIHHNCRRRRKKFVPVNCGAIAETLFESELFGHVRGAFTGAIGDKKGLMEEADGGTAFLDEIGETPPAIQVKLLRFLQDGEVRPVGATRCRNLSVRILAAAQNDLQERIKDGRFREDLFYRLNFFTIEIPPLRKRKEDIPLIAEFWLKKYAREMGKQVRFLDPGALRHLRDHAFPGNVRELQNMVAHAVALSRGDTLSVEDFPTVSNRRNSDSGPRGAVPESLQELKEVKQKAQEEIEKAFLLQALERYHWNISRTARETGINRSVFHEMMTRHNISREK